MSGNSADLERAVAHLSMRSHLVEMVLHGHSQWTVLIDGNHVNIETAMGLDERGDVIVSFFIPRAPANETAYHIHADGVHIHSEPGSIIKDRPCRLRMTFPVESELTAVSGM